MDCDADNNGDADSDVDHAGGDGRVGECCWYANGGDDHEIDAKNEIVMAAMTTMKGNTMAMMFFCSNS